MEGVEPRRAGAPDRAAERLLTRLEGRLLALRERLEGAGRPPARRSPGRRAPSRLRFSPAELPADRLVLTNTHAGMGYVRLGDAELELRPGESATLWVERTAPAPAASLSPELAPRGDRFLLWDDAAGMVG